MRPTEILRNEHRVIERVLDCLEKMAQRCQRDGTLDAPDAHRAVDFFRMFADQCHHAKEETHLFPAMEAKGLPREGGPTGVMLYEHERGRAFVKAMAEVIDGAASGDDAARTKFVSSARGYIELLRQHIDKEDHCLFAMANQAFSDTDQQQLQATFEAVEAEFDKAGTHEKYLKLASELAERYGVATALTPETDHVHQTAISEGFPYKWPMLFLGASAGWAFLGAGVFGSIITTPW